MSDGRKDVKHTPGPWETQEKRSWVEIRETVSPDRALVAIVEAVPPGIALDIRANARLIAAAPELLEACLQAANAIPTTHGAFEVVRAAIKKAMKAEAHEAKEGRDNG